MEIEREKMLPRSIPDWLKEDFAIHEGVEPIQNMTQNKGNEIGTNVIAVLAVTSNRVLLLTKRHERRYLGVLVGTDISFELSS